MIIRDLYLLKRSECFNISPGEEISVDLNLQKALSRPNTKLIGRVLSHCTPVVKATVKVFNLKHQPIEHTMTDSHGEFSFINVLPPGEYYVVATANGYKTSKDHRIFLLPCITIDLSIQVHPNTLLDVGTVYGIIYDELGKPLYNATVVIADGLSCSKIKAVTTSNEDGEYLIYGLSKGKYHIYSEKVGYIPPETVPFKLNSNEILPIDMILTEAETCKKGMISGIITHNGAAIPHAIVALYLVKENNHILIALKEANEKGRYLFSNVEPGEYLIKSKVEEIELKRHETVPLTPICPQRGHSK